MPERPRLRLDAIDQKLLDLLQEDAARSLYELGDKVGLSPSAVQRRLTRYRKTGLITRQAAILNPEAVPGTVLACVLVTFERESKRLHTGFQERMRATPEVQQCYDLAGQWDYLVMVVANGMPHCRSVIDSLFLGAPNIKRYDTIFVFDVIKAGLRIPLRPAQNLRARNPR
jgi:Lrp/AsnC family transcriptional regulator, leucine-responsive regulatory protein